MARLLEIAGEGIKKVKAFLAAQGIDSDITMVGRENGMELHKLPIREDYADQNAKLRRCMIGQISIKDAQKTIMVIGATGTGKSTLIDGICNYIFGTQWTDKHRLLLVDEKSDEKKNKEKGQAMSQTEWITVYTITSGKESTLPFTLNLIDTPGFGDTRGIQRDKQIVDQIRLLFETPQKYGIDAIDAVCFLAKAPDARLTPTQRYIFDSILSVFGTDIGDNILVMITFADGATPPVLQALQAANMPFKKHFKFNNSALFANNEEQDSEGNDSGDENDTFSKMFWKMGMQSFKSFFKYVGKLESKSLTLTTEVLQKRYFLQETLRYLMRKVNQGLRTMHQLKEEERIFEQNKKAIKDNKDFAYQVKQTRIIKKSTGKCVTYCGICKNTCHDNCAIFEDSEKMGCWAMTGSNCRICYLKCHWSEHRNTGFTEVAEEHYVTKTYSEMKAKYEEADGKALKGLEIIKRTNLEYKKTKEEVKKYVRECKESLERLKEIALKPDPLTETEYIDILIQTEREEHNGGFEDRIRELQVIKEEAKMIGKIHGNKEVLPEVNVTPSY